MVENEKGMAAGVIPSKMAVGDSVLVETDDYMFNIIRESENWFVESGSKLVRNNNMVVGIASIPEGSHLIRHDLIAKNERMQLTTPYGTAIITKPVISAIFKGNGYEVSVWD